MLYEKITNSIGSIISESFCSLLYPKTQYQILKLWRLASQFQIIIKTSYERVKMCYRKQIYPHEHITSEIDDEILEIEAE